MHYPEIYQEWMSRGLGVVNKPIILDEISVKNNIGACYRSILHAGFNDGDIFNTLTSFNYKHDSFIGMNPISIGSQAEGKVILGFYGGIDDGENEYVVGVFKEESPLLGIRLMSAIIGLSCRKERVSQEFMIMIPTKSDGSTADGSNNGTFVLTSAFGSYSQINPVYYNEMYTVGVGFLDWIGVPMPDRAKN